MVFCYVHRHLFYILLKTFTLINKKRSRALQHQNRPLFSNILFIFFIQSAKNETILFRPIQIISSHILTTKRNYETPIKSGWQGISFRLLHFSSSQNLDRQIDAFLKDGADEHDILTENVSGKDMDKETYRLLKDHLLRRGDTLVITSLDRLGRNKEQIKNELHELKKKGVRVRILDIPTTNISVNEGQEWIIDMVNTILIEVLASQAEQERLTIRKRQAEGIALAKKAGKYKGGKEKEIDQELFDFFLHRHQHRQISKKEMAEKLHISRPTLDKLIKKKDLMT